MEEAAAAEVTTRPALYLLVLQLLSGHFCPHNSRESAQQMLLESDSKVVGEDGITRKTQTDDKEMEAVAVGACMDSMGSMEASES